MSTDRHPKSGSARRFLFKPHQTGRLQFGPLEPHIGGFADLLTQLGYSDGTGRHKIRLVAHFARWMAQRRVAPKELNEDQIARFLKSNRSQVEASGDRATMALLLRYLRESKIISAALPPSLKGDIDLLEDDYAHFLRHERNLTPASIEQYLPVIRRFLSHRFREGKVWLKKLRASDVMDFVLHDSANRGCRSAQLMATVLRSFFGFLLRQGRITINLAAAVPMVAARRLARLPRFLETDQVENVLRSCDRRRKVGKRDFAILLLLARLGLRAGEVVHLSLDDIDWRASELRIRGKGARVDRLPLPQDVGQALADYLTKARPSCSSRRVFIQTTAPYEGFAAPSSIGNVVRRALARAKILSRHQGAHLLRHSLATTMLRNGASLAQIGQVLRHQLPQTTEIYAKVNLDALRKLAVPWLGGGL